MQKIRLLRRAGTGRYGSISASDASIGYDALVPETNPLMSHLASSRPPIASQHSRRARAVITAQLLALQLAGCSSLTDVRAPDVVQPSSLDNRAGGEARRAGAITLFTNALVSRISATSIMADELFSTTANGDPADQRIIRDPDAYYPYASVQQARINAVQAIITLQRYGPTPRSNIGQLFVVAGYTELFLG